MNEMTDDEWRNSTDPILLMDELIRSKNPEHLNVRKWRLFLVSVCMRHSSYFDDFLNRLFHTYRSDDEPASNEYERRIRDYTLGKELSDEPTVSLYYCAWWLIEMNESNFDSTVLTVCQRCASFSDANQEFKIQCDLLRQVFAYPYLNHK